MQTCENIRDHCKHVLVRLGYRLLNSGLYHDMFRVGICADSIKVINSLAFAANRAGLQGVALIAKVERGRIDENFLGWGNNWRKLCNLLGKLWQERTIDTCW